MGSASWCPMCSFHQALWLPKGCWGQTELSPKSPHAPTTGLKAPAACSTKRPKGSARTKRIWSAECTGAQEPEVPSAECTDAPEPTNAQNTGARGPSVPRVHPKDSAAASAGHPTRAPPIEVTATGALPTGVSPSAVLATVGLEHPTAAASASASSLRPIALWKRQRRG